MANIVNDWRTEIVGSLDADGEIKRKNEEWLRKKAKDHTKAKANPKKTKENKERNHDPTNDNIPISPSHRNYKDLSDLHLSETDKNTILPLE